MPDNQTTTIIKALVSNGGRFTDDHKCSTYDRASVFAILRTVISADKVIDCVCPLPEKSTDGQWIISLNPIIIEDDGLHLSKMSLAELIHPGDTIEDAVLSFNADMAVDVFSKVSITGIIKI